MTETRAGGIGHDLFVTVGTGARRRFSPAQSPVEFGRSAHVALRVATDPGVSRVAGSFRYSGGQWWLSNTSTRHALHLGAEDGSRPLAVARGDVVESRVIEPPGEVVLILTGTGRVRILVETQQLPPDPRPGRGLDGSEPSTPRSSLNPHDRRLLASKFLAQGRQGRVLGNKEAAAFLNEYRARSRRRRPGLPPGPEVTAVAVMDADQRARALLTALGIPGILGQAATREVRRVLLAEGLLSEDDAPWLRGAS